MDYTAEEVRDEATATRHYPRVNPGAETEWDRHVGMLTAYAALLERQAAGVTDDVCRLVLAKLPLYCASTPIEMVRAALLAVWPVSAEPVAQQAARVDEAMVERACAAYERAEDRAYYGVRKRFMRAALEAALSAQPAERQGDGWQEKCAAIEANRNYWYDEAERLRMALHDPTHPAAPVGVPKPKTEMDYEYDEEGLLDTYCTGHMDGWNDCLKALAAAPPQRSTRPGHDPDCNLNMASIEAWSRGCDCSARKEPK